MSAIASQIISLAIVYWTVYSRRRSKKTSKLRVTGFCEGNSPATGEFPAQRASNAENVSLWWRHHVLLLCETWVDQSEIYWWFQQHIEAGTESRHITDDIFKFILLNESYLIFIQISPQFVVNGPSDDTPALV